MDVLQKHEMPELASCLEVLTNQLASMAKDFSNLHTSLVTFSTVLKKENLLRPPKTRGSLKPTIENAPTAPASPKTKPSTPTRLGGVRGLDGLRPSLADAPTAPGSPKTKPSTPTRCKPSPDFGYQSGEDFDDGFMLQQKETFDLTQGAPTICCGMSKSSPSQSRYVQIPYDNKENKENDSKCSKEEVRMERTDSPSVKYHVDSSDNSDMENELSVVEKDVFLNATETMNQDKFEVEGLSVGKDSNGISSRDVAHQHITSDVREFDSPSKKHRVSAGRRNIQERQVSAAAYEPASERQNTSRSKSYSALNASKLKSKEQPNKVQLSSSSSIYLNSQNRVLFNVGGKYFDTSISTITKFDNILASMVSGKFGNQREPDGSIFIDRDWEYFRHCINYLRDGDSYLTSLRFISRGERVQLISEAKFYGLTPLYKWLEALEKSRRQSEMGKDTTFKRYRYETMNVGMFQEKMKEWASCWDFEFMILEPSQGRRTQPRFHLILSQAVSRQELELIERLTARG